MYSASQQCNSLLGGLMIQYLKQLSIVFSVLAILSCKSLEPITKKIEEIASDFTSPNYYVLDSNGEKISELDDTHKRVISALEMNFRGESPQSISQSTNVNFLQVKRNSMQQIVKDMKVDQVVLSEESLNNSNVIEGLMAFKDQIGRVVHVGFRLAVNAQDESVVVSDAVFNVPVFATPKTEFVLVPLYKLDQYAIDATHDYVALYKSMKSKSIDPTRAPDEEQTYIVFAFYKTILPADMSLAMKVSKSQRGLQGDGSFARYKFYDQAWMVTLLEIKANFRQEKYWIKSTIQGTDDHPEQEMRIERLLATYALGSGG